MERLDDISVPLLVMVGSLDESGTWGACRHPAETIPGARLEVFDGAAHMLSLEQPDRFNALLAEFLAADHAL
ncbi:MAG: hypothetical protein ABIO99_09340 [Candidatus Limnocylindria bacterium]